LAIGEDKDCRCKAGLFYFSIFYDF